MSSIRLTLLGVALAGVAGCGGDDGPTPRRLELAIQDDALMLQGRAGEVTRAHGLRTMRSLGVTRIKVNASWAYLAPGGRGAYDFGPIVDATRAAGRYGMRVTVAFTGPAPAWATGNGRPGPDRPSVGEFGEFVRQGMRRLGGRVDRFSIWNEPNWGGWLSPMDSAPAQYRRLYQEGYAQIKRASPEAKVLFGELAPSAQAGRSVAPLRFLREVFCTDREYRPVRRCARLRSDGFAMHPYDLLSPPDRRHANPDDVTMANLDALGRALDRLSRHGALRANGGGRMPLYLTEFGYMSSGGRARPERTKWWPRAFDIAVRNRRVHSMTQYLLVSPPPGSTGAFFDTGLLSSRGAPQPLFRAARRWTDRALARGDVERPGPPIR
jgi:hypothetical protein